MSEGNNHFPTYETALAVYLIVKGFELSSIDYSEPRYKYIFETNPNKDIDFFIIQYASGKASVDPAQYAKANKKLLRIIKNQRQWEDDFNG